MVIMNKNELSKLYGKRLFSLMEEMLNEFIEKNYTIEELIEALKDINETIRVGLYLMALEKSYEIALRLNVANLKLNEIRKEKFLEAFKKNETKRFLATLGKSDKISLMSDLGINVDIEKRALFNLEQRIYYELINESILQDQEIDRRNGVEQFLKHNSKKN